LDEYEQLLYTIITNNRTDHVGLAVELTTRFCQAGKLIPATQGVKYLLSLLEHGVLKPHYLGLSTMMRWLNGLTTHGHGQKCQQLVEAATSHRSFTPTMLLPGQLAEALSNNRSSAEWQSQFDSLLANVKSCFVPDLNAVIRWLGRRHHLQQALQLVDAMIAMGVKPDAETYEFIANAAVRSVEKVASAKSMKALPPSRRELPEIVFVGRSNVGKSSLVNMVVNRKVS
jgi:pentatricopeptide repeat protein